MCTRSVALLTDLSAPVQRNAAGVTPGGGVRTTSPAACVLLGKYRVLSDALGENNDLEMKAFHSCPRNVLRKI